MSYLFIQSLCKDLLICAVSRLGIVEVLSLAATRLLLFFNVFNCCVELCHVYNKASKVTYEDRSIRWRCGSVRWELVLGSLTCSHSTLLYGISSMSRSFGLFDAIWARFISHGCRGVFAMFVGWSVCCLRYPAFFTFQAHRFFTLPHVHEILYADWL